MSDPISKVSLIKKKLEKLKKLQSHNNTDQSNCLTFSGQFALFLITVNFGKLIFKKVLSAKRRGEGCFATT